MLEGLLYVDLYSEGGNVDETLKLSSSNTPYLHDGLIYHRTYTKDDWCLYQEVYHGTHNRDFDVIEMEGVWVMSGSRIWWWLLSVAQFAVLRQ